MGCPVNGDLSHFWANHNGSLSELTAEVRQLLNTTRWLIEPHLLITAEVPAFGGNRSRRCGALVVLVTSAGERTLRSQRILSLVAICCV